MTDYREIPAATEALLQARCQLELSEADTAQIHNALAEAVMAAIAPRWRASRRAHESKRRAYYFSAEYLTGRSVFSNLYNLGMLDGLTALFRERGVDLADMEDIEDAALGNGGLGRLAACFLDSAATHDIYLDGYGLRYRFGLFKQQFRSGWQVERADDWQRNGDPWSLRRNDKIVDVAFADGTVHAVPYDMPIIGYNTDNIGTLRLWQAEPIEEFDFTLFNEQDYAAAVREKNRVEDITRVLYPNDSTVAGKQLRLKQQYFLASASLQDIVRRYKRLFGGDLSRFAEHAAIQLNDTHPVVGIPELIRLLTESGMDFDAAFDVAASTFAYTNHTIMSEALETWDISLFNSVVPSLYPIIERINARLEGELRAKGCSDWRIANMRILSDGRIHMARMACYVSFCVNGVAEIHTGLLRERVFKDWFEVWPDKLQNKTNGITQRRWLGLCDTGLSSLITEKIGDGFLFDLSEIARLEPHIDGELALRFNAVKRLNKERLSRIIYEREGVELPPDMVFDVQVKRMHEYKRQLLNALTVAHLWQSIKEGTLTDFTPTAFIFGAKAAPGYYRAKSVIKYINELAARINADPAVNELMRVVFVQNYNCSYAEHIIPAADISAQLSQAGTEASGTGNMKLMLNGAVTLGTYDGANIEIFEAAGAENNYVFGATVEELDRIRDAYDPKAIYDSDPAVRRAVDTLIDGTVDDGGSGAFRDLYDSLIFGVDWRRPDSYFTLYDFRSLVEARLRANRDYRDRAAFGMKCLRNTAAAGRFSSDHTVSEYAKNIWRI